jgi:hypothetical protein
MLRYTYVIITCIAALLAACTGEETFGEGGDLIGSWASIDDPYLVEITFNSDGTFNYTGKMSSDTGKYKYVINAQTVTITGVDADGSQRRYAAPYTADGESLTMLWGSFHGDYPLQMHYRRVLR